MIRQLEKILHYKGNIQILVAKEGGYLLNLEKMDAEEIEGNEFLILKPEAE